MCDGGGGGQTTVCLIFPTVHNILRETFANFTG